MSRCFPFPPPGYEKKARVEDTDLLIKEKHKEKRHKKDKKDKEKRESKEKKDKDRSKEKHKEKKERKEKRKDKDKDRDKEKKRTSDEKRVEGEPGSHIGEKYGPNGLQKNDNSDSKYVQELARRIRDEERASESQMVQKIAGTDQRVEWRGMAVEGSIGNQSEGKKKVKDKNEDHAVNGQRNHIDARGLGKGFGQVIFGVDQERVEGIAKPGEKRDVEQQLGRKEKSKIKESDDKSVKHKGKDREKHKKSKEKDRDKEKEEKAKEITQSSKERPKLKESNPKPREGSPKLKESSKDSLDFRIIRPSDPLKLNSISPISERNLGKRKELEINGYLQDNGNRPNKFPRPLSSPAPVIENGRKLEPSQTAIQFASEKHGPAKNHKVDVKGHNINGLIVTQQASVGSTGPSSTCMPHIENGEVSLKVPADVNSEASKKPPHPDTKFLNQILSVPKLEEWPDFDDQEWLFGSNPEQSRKPDKCSLGLDATQQVWAEALRIESADISALPYVIPY